MGSHISVLLKAVEPKFRVSVQNIMLGGVIVSVSVMIVGRSDVSLERRILIERGSLRTLVLW